MTTRPRRGRAADFLIRLAGALPPREAKVRTQRCAPTLLLRGAEAFEVRRARRAIGPTAHARIVTIIPTIGRDLLRAAVASALAQTVRDHHVVVVSDGRPLPLLPDDPRLSIVFLRRQYGVAALARNVGIRASASEYVAFLDDDNLWRPDHLERLLRSLANGTDLAYSGLEWIGDDGRSLGAQSIAFDRSRLRDESFVDTSTIVVRRSPRTRFRDVPRRYGDATFEDWELVWRLSRRGRVVHVPASTVVVRAHGGQCFVPRVAPPPVPVPPAPSVAAGG